MRQIGHRGVCSSEFADLRLVCVKEGRSHRSCGRDFRCAIIWSLIRGCKGTVIDVDGDGLGGRDWQSS